MTGAQLSWYAGAVQRRLLAVLLMVGVAVPTGPASAAAAEPGPTAKELYDQGRTAYRLGKFKEAVDAWEKSYDLSEGNPLLLYNIALAYNGLFGIAGDIKDLRRAEAVMKSFITVAEADAALAGELTDARARRDEFLAEIARQEQKQAASGPSAAELAQAQRTAAAERKAKKLRLAGAVTMGVGGGVMLTGVGLGVFFVVKSTSLKSELANAKGDVTNLVDSEFADACLKNADDAAAYIRTENASPGNGDQGNLSDECLPAIDDLARVATARADGPLANTLAIVGFAAIGGVGLAALIAGAVVFAQGNRANRGARTARLQIAPSFGGRAGTGFVLHGRF